MASSSSACHTQALVTRVSGCDGEAGKFVPESPEPLSGLLPCAQTVPNHRHRGFLLGDHDTYNQPPESRAMHLFSPDYKAPTSRRRRTDILGVSSDTMSWTHSCSHADNSAGSVRTGLESCSCTNRATKGAEPTGKPRSSGRLKGNR